MNIHKLMLLVQAFALTSFSGHSQLLNVKLGADELIENAVKDAIVIVETNYCILDIATNQRYGRNGNPYFNERQFIGCRTANGIVTSREATAPWENDRLFEKYRDDSQYRPILDGSLRIYSTEGNEERTIEIDDNSSFSNDSTLMLIATNSNSVDGLMLSDDTEATSNWVIWVKKRTDNGANTAPLLDCVVTKKELVMSADSETPIEAPNDLNTFLGGIYVSAKNIGVGLVEFSLIGLVVNRSNQWFVKQVDNDTFKLDVKDDKSHIETPSTSDGDNELTPVKDGKKKKKSNKEK